MKRRTGPPSIYLASSGTGDRSLPQSREQLLSLLATLEECRDFLKDKASPETAKLLSLAILELRMELHQVSDAELKQLCDLMVTDDRLTERGSEGDQDSRFPHYLKLVK